MAVLEITYNSSALSRNVTIMAVIPTLRAFPGRPAPELKPLKSMYLLHGIFGNQTDWVSGTRIQALAEAKNVAVFMPAGENSFYVDDEARGNLYGKFIGEELVKVTRDMFRLSDKPEDTCIAGLSMGGYGCIRNGLKYCENYGRIAALSSALVTYTAPQSTEESFWTFGKRSYFEAIFGDLDKLPTSDNDPEGVFNISKAAGKPIPKMFMACGTEDSLLDVNRRYRDFLNANGVDLTYVEGPGAHTWEFWDKYIETALDWFCK